MRNEQGDAMVGYPKTVVGPPGCGVVDRDPELLRVEFDALIAANFPEAAESDAAESVAYQPPRRRVTVATTAAEPIRPADPRDRRGDRDRRMGRRRGQEWARQRGPPRDQR